MYILKKEDFSPKFDSLESTYLQRGNDRYDELLERYRVPVAKGRSYDNVSGLVKRYLILFVSKEYSRDRIGSSIRTDIDGQTVDQWQNIFNTYDAEEQERVNEITVYDLLKDEYRSETNDTSSMSITIRRS